MENNSMHDMMKSGYGEDKLDKTNELNETMTILETGADEYSRTIVSLGGNTNE